LIKINKFVCRENNLNQTVSKFSATLTLKIKINYLKNKRPQILHLGTKKF